MDDLHNLSIMVGDKWKIGDYLYINTEKGITLESGTDGTRMKYKLTYQNVINLKLKALSFEVVCPNAFRQYNIIYKIKLIEEFKIRCERIEL